MRDRVEISAFLMSRKMPATKKCYSKMEKIDWVLWRRAVVVELFEKKLN